MAALPQCDAFGVIYDQHGGPAINALVTLRRVDDANGNPILLGPLTTITDSDGVYHFTLPQSAHAFITARATTLWDCNSGIEFLVPAAATGALSPVLTPPIPPESFSVQPPLYYSSGVFSITRSSATSDGYLAAEDFIRFDEASGALPAGTGSELQYRLDADSFAAFPSSVDAGGLHLAAYLTLVGNPVSTFHAATKNYVDQSIAAIPAGGVTSFNTRTGAVVPLGPDYAAFYAALSHTHTKAQITDLAVFTLSAAGLVPAPVTSTLKFLRDDGSWAAVGGSGTVTQIIAGTGLSGGTITTSGTIALTDTAVTIGTYKFAQLTVDQQGRLTAASTGTVFSVGNNGLVPAPTGADASKVLSGAGTWVAQTAAAPVTSVFTRTGAVVALVGDYSAFYAPLVHTHVRADITNLGIFSTSQPGLVPQPTAGDAAKFLTGAGTWLSAAAGSVDTTANYTWTGTHQWASPGGIQMVQGIPISGYPAGGPPLVDMLRLNGSGYIEIGRLSSTDNTGIVIDSAAKLGMGMAPTLGGRLDMSLSFATAYGLLMTDNHGTQGGLTLGGPWTIGGVAGLSFFTTGAVLFAGNSGAPQVQVDSSGLTLLTGNLTLVYDPTLPLHAATKQYVDGMGSVAGVASFNTRTGAVTLSSTDVTTALTYTPVNKAGDTMAGLLTLSGDATSALHAVSKQQSDAKHAAASANGSNAVVQTASELLTLNTGGLTTDTVANLLPAGSIILAVTGRITTTLTGGTSWKLGDPTTADRFTLANSTLTAGTTAIGINQFIATRNTAGMGPDQAAAAKVRVTMIGQPSAGAIRISVWYIQLTAPTS